jgi:flagellar protein FlbD
MIKLTRLNHVSLLLNSDLIELIDTTPDTVISMTTGQKLMVLETADEIVEKIIKYRQTFAAATCPYGRRSTLPEIGKETDTQPGR